MPEKLGVSPGGWSAGGPLLLYASEGSPRKRVDRGSRPGPDRGNDSVRCSCVAYGST